MQPIKKLTDILNEMADTEHYLFSLQDLQAALPGQNPSALKALAGRAVKNGLLHRVCRGLYLFPRVRYPAGLVLYHAAARLRAGEFNYISLESALSDAGIISQVPMNWVTIMSSGRSHTLDCGNFGHIEFVHTAKTPAAVAPQLSFDRRCRLWRASIGLAIRDMKLTGRDTGLIDWEAVREPV